MSANIDRNGKVRQLDKPAEPDQQVMEDEATDAPRLVRLLMRMLRDLAALKRRWAPRRLDFEDCAVDATGTTKYRLPHGLGGRVRWWVVDWADASAAPALVKHADTDERTLVLVSRAVGTATIRIEEAG